MRRLIAENESTVDQPIWEFPKGKKNTNETNIEAAIRETCEETSIKIKRDQIISDEPLVEYFIGSDRKYYSTHYYLVANAFAPVPSRIETPDRIRSSTLSSESEDAGWFTLEEAKCLLEKRGFNILRYASERLSGLSSFSPKTVDEMDSDDILCTELSSLELRAGEKIIESLEDI